MNTEKEHEFNTLINAYYSAGDRRDWDGVNKAEAALVAFGAVQRGNRGWVVEENDTPVIQAGRYVFLVEQSIKEPRKPWSREDVSVFTSFESAQAFCDGPFYALPPLEIKHAGDWKEEASGIWQRSTTLLGGDKWAWSIMRLPLEGLT